MRSKKKASADRGERQVSACKNTRRRPGEDAAL